MDLLSAGAGKLNEIMAFIALETLAQSSNSRPQQKLIQQLFC
jgi:hypothetical protein